MRAWENFLKIQEEELGAETVQKWLRSLKLVRFDAGNIFLEAKDSFQAIWFEEHVHAKAQAFLVNGNSRKIKIHLSIANHPGKEKDGKESGKGKGAAIATPFSFEMEFDSLNPSCTIENFIETEKNTLVYKLLRELTRGPSATPQTATFNPIYLHGGAGVGKTHLLMALCHSFRKQGLKATYVRSETFTNHVVGAIRSGQMSAFRQTYRNIDILLLDDVHVFSRKAATQEELFHTFNTLHTDGKQIVIAANCAPNELQLIEARLISRFEWGIVLPLSPFSPEEMLCILNHKATSLNFALPLKVAEFLVASFTSSARSLVKALEALVLRLHLDVQHSTAQLTVPLVKQTLSDLLVEEEQLAITIDKILSSVAEHYGIRPEDILSKAQSRDRALPRQVAMALCRTLLGTPYMKIGEAFSRDHSTVMASVKQIQNELDQDNKEIAGDWHAILKKLKMARR